MSKVLLIAFVLMSIVGCSKQASTGSGSEVTNGITISLNASSDYVRDSVFITIRPDRWGVTHAEGRAADSMAEGLSTNGTFNADNLISGDYTILFEERGSGYATMRGVSLFGGGIDSITSMTLEKGAAITGIVDRAAFPLNSVLTVQLVGSDKIVSVDSQGHFVLENFPSGEHELVLSVAGSNETTLTVSLPEINPGETKSLDSVQFESSVYFDKSEWAHTIPVQFSYSGGTATLDEGTAYPILCKLSGIDFSGSHPAGADLRILSSEEKMIPFEILQWNRGEGGASITIQMENISTPQQLDLYFGNEKVRSASDPIKTYAQSGDLLLFHFDDTSAGNMKDALQSGVESDTAGQSVGTLPLSVDGYIGKALQFDGVDDYLVLPCHEKVQLGDEFTVLCWVNLSAHDTVNGRILSKSEDWEIKENMGYLQFSSGGAYILSSELLPTGEWIQLAVSVSRTQESPKVSLYVNGVKLAIKENTFATTFNSAAIKTDQPLFVGSLGNKEKFYNFAIDELRLFHSTLNDDEIALFYASEGGVTPLFINH